MGNKTKMKEQRTQAIIAKLAPDRVIYNLLLRLKT